MLIKVSFFFLYLQIIQPLGWLRIRTYIGAISTSFLYGEMTVALFIFATPARGKKHGNCTKWHDRNIYYWGCPFRNPSLNLLLIYTYWFFRSRLFPGLQMPTRRKFGVIMLIFMTGFTVHKTLSFVQRWASSNIYRACLGSLLSIYYRNIFHHSEDKTWVLTPVNTVTWVRSLLMFTLELRKAADYSPFLLISLVENIYWDHVCLHACSCALLSSPSPPLQHVQILFPFPYPQYTIQPQPTPFSLVYGLQGPQPRQATAA